MTIYIVGSLANPNVPVVANRLRKEGHDAFSSWYCASENADIRWQEHEQGRGLSYVDALKDFAAQHVFKFDKHHLERCDAALLVYPAGRSGHLELGYAAGFGKKTYILLDKEPEKWDVMLNFATAVHADLQELIDELKSSDHLIHQECGQDSWVLPPGSEHPDFCCCVDCLGVDWNS